jgi:hypothetical protein
MSVGMEVRGFLPHPKISIVTYVDVERQLTHNAIEMNSAVDANIVG